MILVLGAGYVGAAVAARALDAGERVLLADNWLATRREQLDGLRDRGAEVRTADIRSPDDLDGLLAGEPDRVVFLAAQASRPLSLDEPDLTEQINVTGARRVAEAVVRGGGPPVVYGSSLHVYGPSPRGDVGPDHPYGPQGDLAHLSKVYAELCLRMYAERSHFDLALLRLGIVYGPSPVEHDARESQTVIDRFRRMAAAGDALTVDGGGRATIGAVHVDDAARILLDEPAGEGVRAENVAAEALTVGQVAALARAEERSSAPAPSCRFLTPYRYDHDVAGYLRG